MSLQKSIQGDTLADVLERILDKGVVIAGDIKISIGEVELLKIQLRLIIASVDKAQEMGINWWSYDTELTSKNKMKELEQENKLLKEELDKYSYKLDSK
jgi:hypothetical protein